MSATTIGPVIHKRLAQDDLVSPKFNPQLTGLVLSVDHGRNEVRYSIAGSTVVAPIDSVIAR